MDIDAVLLLPPFRRKDASKYGLTDSDVRRHLYNGNVVRLAHGILVGRYRADVTPNSAEAEALRAAAMIERYKPAAAARRTAAAIHDMWIIGAPGPVDLYRLHGSRQETSEVRVQPLALPAKHLTEVHRVLLTTVARTSADLVAGTPDIELQAIFDSALRLGVTKAELRDLLNELGIRRSGLADLIEFADDRSESALESISRWLFRARGLPTPKIQVSFEDDQGPFARVDFFWPRQRIVGEADGELKYDEAGVAKRAEEARQLRLEALGVTVVRWGFDDVMIGSDSLVARLGNALAM